MPRGSERRRGGDRCCWRSPSVLCALGAALCAVLYAGITGRSPSEVSLSGQATLAQLAADPHARSVGGRRVHALPGQPARRSDPSHTALASAGLGVVPGMAAASAATLRLVVLVVGNSETVPVTFVTTELLPQEPEIPAFSAGPGRAPRPASSRP